MGRKAQQYYIPDNKPASNSAKDIFAYCVTKVNDKDFKFRKLKIS